MNLVCLLGRECLQQIGLDLKEICSMAVKKKPNQAIKVEELLQKHSTVFKDLHKTNAEIHS